MKLKGVFISGIEGNSMEVTDYYGAVKQTKQALKFHEECEKNKDNPNVFYFKDAHESWKYTEKELINLGFKLGISYELID